MSDEDFQPNLPEGRRVKKTSSSREKLYLKRKQLLEEMQSTDDNRPIPVREQLEKLKSAGREDAIDEEKWGQKTSRKSGSPWMLWVILGLVIPVLFVGLILMSKNGSARASGGNAVTGLDFDTLSGANKVEPEDWFVENSGEAFSRSFEILEELSQEDLAMADVVPLVRSSGQADQLMEMIGKGEWSGFDTSNPTELRWSYGSSGESGFMTLTGVRKDFRDFRAYFVREGSELLFDLEATEGVSDVPVSKLPGEVLVESALVRCWIAKQPNFDGGSDEELFSWYQILGPGKVDFVWAYCKRGSSLDEFLRTKLNYGVLIGELKDYIRGTVMLGNARGFRDDEFLLEEFVADEWVLPEVE